MKTIYSRVYFITLKDIETSEILRQTSNKSKPKDRLKKYLQKKTTKKTATIKSIIKGATKLYFTHYSCVVIILFNTGSYKSAFSPILLAN